MSLELLGLSTALGVALLASITDIRERRIPNVLILIGLLVAVSIAAIGGQWSDALLGSGFGMAFLAFPRLIARDAVGLGDIKLAGVLGLGAGIAGIAVVVGLAVVAAIPVFVWGGRTAGHFKVLPFAPFLAIGVAGCMAVRLAAGGG